MAYFAAAVGLLVGLATGWFGHRRVLTWCEICTRPVGSICLDCRDRARAGKRSQVDFGKAA